MAYTLYYNPDSANIVIRMILEELGQAYEDRLVPRKRADRDADFMALNPRGLLPVLIEREEGKPPTVLFETGAIALYLAERHGGLLPGLQAPQTHAAGLKWLFMLSNTLHADLILLFYSERYVSEPDDIAGLTKAIVPRVRGHLALLDREIGQSGGPWLLGETLSICDFYLGCCIRWSQLYPVGDPGVTSGTLEGLPHLSDLLSRLQERPSVIAALEKEGVPGKAFLGPVTHLPAREQDVIGEGVP